MLNRPQFSLGVAAAIALVCALGVPREAAADKSQIAARLAAADSLRAKGALDEAMREYIAVIAEDGSNCEANYGMARLALAHDDLATAARHVERCESKKGCEDRALIAKAILRLKEGKLDESEAALYKAGTKNLSTEFQTELEETFVALYEAKKYPSLVVEHLDKLIALRDDKASLALRKGRILAEDRQYDLALSAFREAITYDSTSADAYREVAELYTRAKRPADAAEVLTRYADVSRDVSAYLIAAEAWATAERPADARGAYQRAVDIDTTSTPAWLGLARASFQLGDRPAALEAYRRLGPAKVYGTQDNMNVGRALLDAKDHAGAREAFLRAAALDSTLSDANFFTGYAFFAEKKYAESVPHFEKAAALDSTSSATFVNLGLACLQSGKTSRGIEALARAVALRPEDATTRGYLAQAYASASQWSKANSTYQTILESNPDNADALRGLGYSLLNQERYGEAVAALARANGLEPGNVQGLVWLAQGYGMAGDTEKSESTFRKVLAIDPSSQEAKTGLDTLAKSKKGPKKSG
ncbi:MAG: tetratricopeptide repeat protein [bacterium]